jgi:uncharacterized lipoprotein YmbA
MRIISLFLLLITLSGCSSISISDTHFYSLSAFASNNPVSGTSSKKLGVGPIRLPRMLKRPQIITRKSDNELVLSEEHQWGGSLKEDLAQVVSENLSSLLGTEQIEMYPWKNAFKPDYQIRINVEQLDGEPGKTVTLKARWWLLSKGMHMHKDRPAKHSVIKVAVKGKTYADYVSAQSKAVYLLSEKIAQQIH